MNTDVTSKPSKQLSWILAIRPKTLTIGIMQVIVGTVLGVRETQTFHWGLMLSALISCLMIQIGVNLFNDAMDYKKGADNEKRLGFKRATHQGWLTYQEIMIGGCSCIVLALLAGIPMVIYGGIYFLLLLVLVSYLAYGYTGGPFPLAYLGLGEVFVILFYGIVSTVVGFYLQTFRIAPEALLAGVQLGLLAAVVIAINNLRDIEADVKANKKTLAVRFGKTFARLEITLMILLPFFLNIFWSDFGLHKAGLLTLVVMPLGFTLIRCIWYYQPSKIYNTFFGLAALLNFLFGLFLSIGIWL